MASELFGVEGVANSLWNGELAPVELEARQPGWGPPALRWAAHGCGLPLYLLAVALGAEGMDGVQVLAAILLGSLAMLAIAAANGHAGVRYGIPFAVAARVSFGVVGAKLAVALRVLVGCGWMGIVCWVGAEAVFALVRTAAPGLPSRVVWICFVAFLGLAAAGPSWLRRQWLAPVLLVGVATVLSMFGHPQPSAVRAEPGSFLPALTAVIGLWAWSALGAANTARGARTQRQQVMGAVFLPVAATLFGALTLAGGVPGVWNPVDRIAISVAPAPACALLLVLSVALWSEAFEWRARVVAEMVGIAPGTISPPVAGALTALVAVACGPWKLLSDPQHYIATWLVLCAALLAPVAAIMLVEYFALRRRWLNLDDLYQRDGLYEYSDGWNGKAVGALAAGWCAVLCGVWMPALRVLYDGAGSTGFLVAGAVYWLLRSGPPEVAQIPPTPLLIPLEFEGEAASS